MRDGACFEDRFQAIRLTFLSTNRDCPFLEFVGVTVVEQAQIDRETRIARVDAGLLRYTYRCMLRSHSDRSNRISGIRKICTTSLATPTCQVSRECVELHGVANFFCSFRLPTPALAFLSRFFFFFFFSISLSILC